jgi:hypothetical protein
LLRLDLSSRCFRRGLGLGCRLTGFLDRRGRLTLGGGRFRSLFLRGGGGRGRERSRWRSRGRGSRPHRSLRRRRSLWLSRRLLLHRCLRRRRSLWVLTGRCRARLLDSGSGRLPGAVALPLRRLWRNVRGCAGIRRPRRNDHRRTGCSRHREGRGAHGARLPSVFVISAAARALNRHPAFPPWWLSPCKSL